MLHSITVSLGSNVDSRHEEISRAMVWLRRFMPASVETTPYLSAAEQMDCAYSTSSTDTYLNAVVRGRTPHSSEFLLKKFKAYERLRGRSTEQSAKGVIIIDIDLVEFDGSIIDTKEYNSPHFQKGLKSLE